MNPVLLPGLDSSFSVALSRHPLPVIGRTPDARRVALLLRLSRREHSVVWVDARRMQLFPPEMTVPDLPILVGRRAEVYAVDEAGSVGGLVAATDQLERWQWRGDGSVVGASGEGLWHWHPATGALRRFGEWAYESSSLVSATDLVMLVRARPPAQHWYRLDLRTGERRPLPAPINIPMVRSSRPGSGPGWLPHEAFDRYALFRWTRPSYAYERPADVPRLHLYDSRAHTAHPLDDVVPDASLPSSPLQVLWNDAGTRFAVNWSAGPLYVVETDTLRTIAVPGIHTSSRKALLDWSPDGANLLIREWRTVARYDERGFAGYPTSHPDGRSAIIDLHVINAADGRTLHTFRAHGDQCYHAFTGEWSPDGRWLMLGPASVRCGGGAE